MTVFDFNLTNHPELKNLLWQERAQTIQSLRQEIEGIKAHLVEANFDNNEQNSYDDAKQAGHDQAIDQALQVIDKYL